MRRGTRSGSALLVCLASSLLLASTSFAAGPYMSVNVGSTWVEDATNTVPPPQPFSFETEFDIGFNVGASAGYDFGLGRLEGEVAYRQNDIDMIVNDLGEGFVVDGDLSALSLMFNGYWDFETISPVTPYLGAGIGFANVSANDLRDVDGTIVDDDDLVFAYQFGAGAAFALNEAMALDLGYRFFATTDPEFTDVEGVAFESEYQTHNISLGLRINF